MRNIAEIFVHCSATKPEWMAARSCQQKVEEIDRWHKANGWSGIGYHFVVDRQGDVCLGRPVEKVGAHVKGHNSNSIGICLVGGHGGASTDKFEDHFTDLQRKALDKLLDDLTTKHKDARIRGHNEVAAKACPSFTVKDYLDGRETKDVQKGSSLPTTGGPTLVDLLMGLLRKLIGG